MHSAGLDLPGAFKLQPIARPVHMAIQPHSDEFYKQADSGIWSPRLPIAHRDDEYDPEWFDISRTDASRALLVFRPAPVLVGSSAAAFGVDAGRAGLQVDNQFGGRPRRLGGLFHRRLCREFAEWALADSSMKSTPQGRHIYFPRCAPLPDRSAQSELARPLGRGVSARRAGAYPGQRERAMREIASSLRPGGLLFVTTPALQSFWSYYDELASHQAVTTGPTFDGSRNNRAWNFAMPGTSCFSSARSISWRGGETCR